ncbi:hypothetical protein U472_13150 [Orenia metallireducens]|uniref:YD repeat-containing protein n=1 Tax=Orenia metallireducens TaxID=1413210 RepID=A0A1C0A581_9FIRM|nr:hypothetical protein [Orenia metallireducens]OCL25298.1 hypothetical protein U472_13150 [Orenia metallireducens]
MKKKNRVLVLLMIFTLMLLLASCRSNGTSPREEVAKQQFKEELETLQRLAKGKTNEVEVNKEDVYLVKTEIIEDPDNKTQYTSREWKYDKNDNLLSLVYMNKDGGETYYEKHKYDEKSKLLKSTIKKQFMGGPIYITKTYTYDKDGRKIAYVATNQKDEKCGKGIYQYYSNGQLKYEYSEDGYSKKTKEIYYDKSGEKTKELNSNLMGDSVTSFKCEYDKDGNKIKEIQTRKYKGNGITIITTINYNKFGKITKQISKDENEITDWYESKYDKNGNVIESTSKDKCGNIEIMRKYKYNRHGKEIEMTRFDRNNNGELIEKWRYKNEYDDKNNKVKAKKIIEGEIFTILHYKYKFNN